MLERNSAHKVGGEVYISLHQANLCLENAICATTCKADCYQKRAPGKRNVWISRYPPKVMVCCARYAKMVIEHFLAKAGAGILPTFDSCYWPYFAALICTKDGEEVYTLLYKENICKENAIYATTCKTRSIAIK